MNTATQNCIALASAVFIIALTFWAQHEINARFQMALTHAHFTQAVQLSKKNLNTGTVANKENRFTREGIPTLGGQPRNTGEWIALFNGSARHAPDGGPAFIVNSAGNPLTGAIGVSATNYGDSIEISRPAYRTLKPHRVIVSASGLEHVTKPQKIKT